MVEFKMFYSGRWVTVEPGDAPRWSWVYRSGGTFRLVSSAAVERGLRALRAGERGCLRRGDPLPLPLPLQGQRSAAEATQHKHRHHARCRRYKRYSDAVRPAPRARRDASVQTDTQTRSNNNNVTSNKKPSNNAMSSKLISSDTSTDADIPSKHIASTNTKLTEHLTSPKIRQRIIRNDTDTDTTDEDVTSRRIALDTSPKTRRKIDRHSLVHEENIPSRRIACSTATKLTENFTSPKRRRIICNDTDTSTDENITLKRTVQNGTTDKPVTEVNLAPKKDMTSKKAHMTLKRDIKGRFLKPSKIPNKNKREIIQNENEPLNKINSHRQRKSAHISSDSDSVRQTRSEPARRVLQELSSDTDNFQEKSVLARLRHTDRSHFRKPDKNVVQISSESENDSRKHLSDLEPSQVIFEGKRSRTTVNKQDFKELVIEEDDVMLLRTFIEKNCPHLDLYRFDCEDRYKQKIFYKINPVVKLEQCRRTEKMIRERQRRLFAEQLGLRSVCSSDGEDKRPQKDPLRNNKDRTSEKMQSDRDSTTEKTKHKDPLFHGDVEKKQKKSRPVVVMKRSCVPPGREYSSLEDHSIVAWVSADPRRERAVNGNRLWRLLQDQYTAITGQCRTWHSLRNRYLRYILPSLGHLALPAGQAARLRAAAATGELKARRSPSSSSSSRRASILRTVPVRSASSRRPPPPPPAAARSERRESSASTSPSPPPPRTLRSSGARPASPAPAAHARSSPRYSEVTRRFALRHTHSSTPGAGAADDKAAAPTAGSGPRTRRLYNPAPP